MKKLVSDRWEVIKDLIPGKEVLDLGCVDHDAGQADGKYWLHRKICERAAKAIGVDYLPDDIVRLRGKGYDVIQGNVENLRLGRLFDIVVAGKVSCSVVMSTGPKSGATIPIGVESILYISKI